MYESSFCTNLVILPQILIILLNRGRGNVFNIKCNFTEEFKFKQLL